MQSLSAYRRYRSVAILILALVLAACDIVDAPPPLATRTGRTIQALPVTPVPLPTPGATLVPLPTPGATLVPLPTPGATLVPTAQPTIFPTPFNSQAATRLLAQGLRQRADGDYDAAADTFHQLVDSASQATEMRQARFYLAESYARRGLWASAADGLRAFSNDNIKDDLSAQALFWLARAHEESGAWADAIAMYERYRALQTPLEPYARLRQAAQERALGRIAEAAANYEAAAEGNLPRGERAGAYEQAITARLQLNQPEAALALYVRLIDLASQPMYRTRILAEAGLLAARIGRLDQSRMWLREAAQLAPEAPGALAAVEQLVADPQSGIDPVVAAQVYVLHERWDLALGQFDAAITAANGDAALDLRRRQALARRSSGDTAGALAALAAVGAAAPNSPPGRQAQFDWINTRGLAGEKQVAIDAYREYARAYPEDERSPLALERAAVLLDELGAADEAARQRLELVDRYPAVSQAGDVLFAAGLSFFNAGRFAEAQATMERAAQGANGTVAARGLFWAGRAARQASQNDVSRDLLERTITMAPDSYYAARATELLGQNPQGAVALDALIDSAAWQEAEQWIATWSGEPAYSLAEKGYPRELTEYLAVRRALALQEVGLQSEAIVEWNLARANWQEHPVMLYLLARLAHEHTVPYIALKAAVDLTQRSPDQGFTRAPQALRRLIYPAPYLGPVLQRAREYQVDPRAIYAMLRQESLFDPAATSGAGALGMAQVMPDTARGIAQRLEVADFKLADLYRPALSVRFGIFYLQHQIKTMDGSLHGALAAYNGGPGNAQRWASGTFVDDPDLFVERIDFRETRNYVKLVYGYYGVYQRLYRLGN